MSVHRLSGRNSAAISRNEDSRSTDPVWGRRGVGVSRGVNMVVWVVATFLRVLTEFLCSFLCSGFAYILSSWWHGILWRKSHVS